MDTQRGLALAFADAVIDYLETGIKQGVIYKDDLHLLAGPRECAVTPHLWVDENWRDSVPGITACVDPRAPAFNEFRLRAQIISSILARDQALRLGPSAKHAEKSTWRYAARRDAAFDEAVHAG